MKKLETDFVSAYREAANECAARVIDKMNKLHGKYDGNKLEDIFISLSSSDKKKIHTRAARMGIKDIEVFNEVWQNEFYARDVFGIDPSRVSYQEKHQFHVLSNFSKTCCDWQNLPTSVPDARWLDNGNIVSVPTRRTKSIDFLASSKDLKKTVVVAAKYTDNDGGAQKNQATDLEHFACEAKDKGDDTIVVLLADGKYYQKKRVEWRNENFFDYIRLEYPNKNVFACQTQDFDIVFNDFCR